MMTQTDLTRREARLWAATVEAIPVVPDAPRTPQGWYADPTDPTHVRWWDGAAWSDHVRLAPGAAPTDIVPRFEGAADGPPPPSMMGVRMAHLPIAAPRKWNTPYAWTLAFSPLLSIGAQLAAGVLSIAGTGEWSGIGLSIGWLVLVVASVIRDRRELVRRGYPSPASILWILLSPLAYMIARTITLRRAIGHGSAPLWWYLGSIATTVALAAVVVGIAGANISTSGGQSTTEISRMLEADIIAQGHPTTGVVCPDTVDQSPGATFQCTLLDIAQPTMPGSATVVIADDGASYSVTYTFPSGN